MVSGKPSDVIFNLTDRSTNSEVVLKTLIEEPHKCPGQIMAFKNVSKDHFEFLKKILDSSSVRSAYKIANYDTYLMPSLRYHFSVHNIHYTHIDQRNMIADNI